MTRTEIYRTITADEWTTLVVAADDRDLAYEIASENQIRVVSGDVADSGEHVLTCRCR